MGIMAIAMATGIATLVLLDDHGVIPWILFCCAGWEVLESILTFRRVATGRYGDSDFELRDLVGPLVARIERGKGPGDPDRLFPERDASQADVDLVPGQAPV
jgi:hypothetical protein